MAPVANLVSVEEYLSTHYEPHHEYEAGALFPKPLPTTEHADIVGELIYLIRATYPERKALAELTVRVREDKYLVPHLAILPKDSAQSPYPTQEAEGIAIPLAEVFAAN
jgi:Uma2 family endonuclease